jgi:uncharacterized protein (TIGR03437 family)
MRLFRKWQGIALIAAPLFFSPVPGQAAAPTISGVTDAAGFGPRVAPGSLASIFGANLAGSEASATGFPLPTSLGGASVTISGTSVPLLYANTGQINFQVPSSLASGTASLIVHGPGGASAAFSFTVTASAPAMFQYTSNHAVAQNPDGTTNATASPAAAGSVVTVYLTGIGAVSNPVADGTAAPLSPLSSASAAATASFGAQSATIQFLGLTPGFAGLAQANIQVPTLPSGDYPLVITVGGYVSASAVLSVSGSGTPYTSPLQLTGTVAFANSAYSSLALYNNVAYVCNANQIVMVDVTNPAQPAMIGEFGDTVLNGNGNFCAVNLSASSPYLVEVIGLPYNPESFAIFDLTNPRSPNLLDIATTPYAQMVSMSFSGNSAFVTTSYITYYNNGHGVAAQNGDFVAFDFTNPSNPQFLGALTPATPTLKPATGVVNPSYAFVASSTATGTSTNGLAQLYVMNIATPSTPAVSNQVTINQAAIFLSFAVSGNLLLAAGNTTGQRNPGVPDFDFLGNLTLTTMDVTNPAAPAVIATFSSNLQVNGTFAAAAFTNGEFAVVNNPPVSDDFGPATLMLVDARQPSNLLPYPVATQFGFSDLVATTTGYLLAPTSFGLNIYQLQM